MQFFSCEDDTAEYSRAQRELLGNIFSEIITSDYGYLSSNNCINMVGEMKEKLSRSGADKFIHEMAARKWLHLNVIIFLLISQNMNLLFIYLFIFFN